MINLVEKKFAAVIFIGLIFVTLITNTVVGDAALRGADEHDDIRKLQYISLNSEPAKKLDEFNPKDVVRNGPFLDPQEIIMAADDLGFSEPFDLKQRHGNANTKDNYKKDRVVGGSEMSHPHSFFAMLLHHDGLGWKWAGCGATLLSNCHVVSAAHCSVDRDIEIKGVYVNAYSPFESNKGHPYHFSGVDHMITRDDYDDDTNIADISIIKMQHCLDVNLYPIAEPAHPSSHYSDGIMVNILGFGKMSEQATSLNRVRTLRIAEMPYISRQTCSNTYYGSHIKQDMVCAGFDRGGVDACQGDSGSGLMHFDNNRQKWVHLGIVSWGVGCGRRERPGVYSSIQHYYFWLWEEICLDPDVDSSIPWCQQSYSTRQHGTSTIEGTETATCIAGHNACEVSTDCCSGSCWRGRCLPTTTSNESNPSFAANEGRGGTGGRIGNAP